MRVDRPGSMSRMAEAVFHMWSDTASVREGLRTALNADPLARLTEGDRGTAEIVLAEVLNNVVEHAYATSTGPIALFLSLHDGRLRCRVEDSGAAMPGGEPPAGRAPDPALLPEGGFGWHLIRTLCEGLSYERLSSANRLSFSLPAEQCDLGA